jgi:hypothetical protein
MRERIALLLLFASFPVCVIHRMWNNAPIHPVRWIFFDKSVEQDFRWYLVYNELCISALCVLVSFLIVKRKTRKLQIALWALLYVNIVDIMNYWLFFRRQELLLTLEGMIMVVASVLILKHESIHHHNEKAT